MLDFLGFGFGSFPKELPLWLRPVPPATRNQAQSPESSTTSGKNSPGQCRKSPGQCLSRSKTAKMDSKMPPRRLQEGQNGQDGFQDGSKMSPRRPRWPQESPRRPKRAQRGLQEVLQEGSKKPKSIKNLRTINDFGLFEPSWRTSWTHLWGLLGRLGLS